jgi:hypothetical protein
MSYFANSEQFICAPDLTVNASNHITHHPSEVINFGNVTHDFYRSKLIDQVHKNLEKYLASLV